MGMFKTFDMPEKKPGESLNTADWLIYNQTYGGHVSLFTASLCTLVGSMQLMLERAYKPHGIDKSESSYGGMV